MKNIGLLAAALLITCLTVGNADKANAQSVYYVSRPVIVRSAYPYYYPDYTYYGGWYPGSYQNNYGNYGAYHVMTPVWTGGYRYRYW
jgi:hypothetical protein